MGAGADSTPQSAIGVMETRFAGAPAGAGRVLAPGSGFRVLGTVSGSQRRSLPICRSDSRLRRAPLRRCNIAGHGRRLGPRLAAAAAFVA